MARTLTKKVNVKDIKFDPVNANRGTERGRGMLEKSIREHGFLEAGTLDKNNVLIGGNKRTEVSQEIGLEPDALVIETDGKRPVYIKRSDIDINTEQGRRAAYALNRVAQVSIEFSPDQILADINAGLNLSDMWTGWELQNMIDGDHLAYYRNEEQIFWEFANTAPAGEHDIPTLDPKKQGTINTPYEVWGENPRTTSAGDTLFFYVDDEFFSTIKIWGEHIARSYKNVVEVNFSVYKDTFYPIVLMDIWEKRTFSAWLQSMGAGIIVDANVDKAHWTTCMLGVPKSWRSWCLRAHSGDTDADRDWFISAIETYTGVSASKNKIWMYGGGLAVKEWAKSRKVPWIPERMDVVHGKYEAIIYK